MTVDLEVLPFYFILHKSENTESKIKFTINCSVQADLAICEAYLKSNVIAYVEGTKHKKRDEWRVLSSYISWEYVTVILVFTKHYIFFLPSFVYNSSFSGHSTMRTEQTMNT